MGLPKSDASGRWEARGPSGRSKSMLPISGRDRSVGSAEAEGCCAAIAICAEVLPASKATRGVELAESEASERREARGFWSRPKPKRSSVGRHEGRGAGRNRRLRCNKDCMGPRITRSEAIRASGAGRIRGCRAMGTRGPWGRPKPRLPSSRRNEDHEVGRS